MAEQRQAADRLSVRRDRLALSSDLDRLADRAAERGLDERALELRTVAAHLRSKEVQLRSQEDAPIFRQFALLHRQPSGFLHNPAVTGLFSI